MSRSISEATIELSVARAEPLDECDDREGVARELVRLAIGQRAGHRAADRRRGRDARWERPLGWESGSGSACGVGVGGRGRRRRRCGGRGRRRGRRSGRRSGRPSGPRSERQSAGRVALGFAEGVGSSGRRRRSAPPSGRPSDSHRATRPGRRVGAGVTGTVDRPGCRALGDGRDALPVLPDGRPVDDAALDDVGRGRVDERRVVADREAEVSGSGDRPDLTRETSVPVSTLMSAAIKTADALSVVPDGGTIVPAMTAPGACGTAVSVRAMPFVGPPVMTGSPTAFCHDDAPSMIVAKRA